MAELDGFVLVASRIPRTVALILVGVALAISGLIMQLLTRNRFVEPSTTGASDAAGFALLMVLLFAPGMPLAAKAVLAALGALVGVAGFLALARRIPVRSNVLVPVVGLMYAGVIAAATAFVAYRTELSQELGSWALGDFSTILRGRYEMLYVAAALALIAWIAADRFTVAALGDDTATGLGLDTRAVLVLGVLIVAAVTGVVSVITGMVPFLGLIVPNIASRLVGDNLRRTVPLVAVLGAATLLACDLVARLVRFPYEVPIGVIMGILGSIVFLAMLLGPAQRRGFRSV